MIVIVTEYNTGWALEFEQEAEALRKIFGDEIIEIHHIGSTSVPNLKAKPIIDIMPVVKDIGKIDSFNAQMIALGYEPCGEFGIAGRRYFRKGGVARTHHVHFFQIDNMIDIERHLAVRDYLHTHTDVAEQYGELKATLAKRYPEDSASYCDGKDEFVTKLEKKALSWYRLHK